MYFWMYLLLGVLDIFALFALMFKTFRLPYLEYVREIGIVAITVSLVSYLMRVYFETNGLLDIVLHFILYILFFRYLIKVRFKWAIVISLVYFIYGLISGLAHLAYSLLLPQHDFTQITQIVLAFSIAGLLHIRRRGFSFIIRPPHDVIVKEKLKRSEFLLINLIFLFAAISFTMAMLILDSENFIIIPLNMIVFGLLMYLAYRKDRSRD